MKKLLSLACVSVILGLSVAAQADTWVANTAKNQRGEEVHPLYGGYDATRIAQGGGEEIVCTGRCILAGLIPTTGVAGRLIYVYDTSVADVSTAKRLKLVTGFKVSESGTAGGLVPYPIRFANGISVKLSATCTEESVTVIYADLDQR